MAIDHGRLLAVDELALRRRAEAAAIRLGEAKTDTVALMIDAADIAGAFCLGHARAAYFAGTMAH